jgi:carbon-monoxide dehydrogenase small subunit
MLVNAHELLSQVRRPSREAIRDALSGNYCRCTGYEAIVDAIAAVAELRAAREAGEREGKQP